MRNNIKFAAVASIMMLVPAITSAAASAAVGSRLAAKASSTPGSVNFCTNLSNYAAQVTQKLTQSETNLSGRQTQNQQNLQNRKNTRAQDLATTRNQGDADRQAIYAKLMSMATTDAQKQAVTEFENTIEAAIATRRTAVDAAIAAYWASAEGIMNGRQGSVTTTRQDFANAVNAAVSAAQSACSSGTAPATVRQQFTTALQAAKTQFASNRQSIDKSGPQIKAVAQTRNQAVQAAFAAFHNTAEQARAALKAAFKASTPAASSTTAN